MWTWTFVCMNGMKLTDGERINQLVSDLSYCFSLQFLVHMRMTLMREEERPQMGQVNAPLPPPPGVAPPEAEAVLGVDPAAAEALTDELTLS